MQDLNTEEKLAEMEEVFAGYVRSLDDKYAKVANTKEAV